MNGIGMLDLSHNDSLSSCFHFMDISNGSSQDAISEIPEEVVEVQQLAQEVEDLFYEHGSTYSSYSNEDKEIESKIDEAELAGLLNSPQSLFDLAVQLHRARRTRLAMRWYIRAAVQLHPKAMNNIGAIVLNGTGDLLQANETVALKWFLLATKYGDRKGKLNATQILSLPKMEKNLDRRRAFEMLRELAGEFRSKSVLNNYGCMLARGLGTTPNATKAVRYLEAAAMKGSQIAKFNLGVIYMNGLGGVKQNEELGRSWFDESVEDRTHPDVEVLRATTDRTRLLMIATTSTY